MDSISDHPIPKSD